MKKHTFVLLFLVHAVFVLMLFIPNVLLYVAQFRVTSPFQCALSFSIHVAFNTNALDLYSEIRIISALRKNILRCVKFSRMFLQNVKCLHYGTLREGGKHSSVLLVTVPPVVPPLSVKMAPSHSRCSNGMPRWQA